MSITRISLAAALTLATGALAASSAQASTVTVGSPLTAPVFDTIDCGLSPPPCTQANTTLGEQGANATSPISGVVIRWRITGNYSGTFALRVLRPAANGQYTGAGTSSAVTMTGTNTQTFTSNLPIHAGDLVGIDIESGHLADGNVTGSTVVEWAPALADDSTAAPSPRATDKEDLFNADVQPPPSETAITRLQINRRRRKATFSFTSSDATTFQCKLIRPKRRHHKKPKALFVPCSSPQTYKHLVHGNYRFDVRGINLAGVDPSPAIKRFKV